MPFGRNSEDAVDQEVNIAYSRIHFFGVELSNFISRLFVMFLHTFQIDRYIHIRHNELHMDNKNTMRLEYLQ
jgi:hypothetical protein